MNKVVDRIEAVYKALFGMTHAVAISHKCDTKTTHSPAWCSTIGAFNCSGTTIDESLVGLRKILDLELLNKVKGLKGELERLETVVLDGKNGKEA